MTKSRRGAVYGGAVLLLALGGWGASSYLRGPAGIPESRLATVERGTIVRSRRRHILTQFLLEALTLTFLGGVTGMMLSYVLGWIIGTRPFLATLLDDRTRQTDIELVLSSSILATSTAILGLAGLLSGLWPAVRASRLDPIEALRYE